MIRIYHNDKVIAESSENLTTFRAIAEKKFLPPGLFENSSTISYGEFYRWVTSRCFPEERCGAKDLLNELGMKKYNAIEIVQKTNERLFQDSFSVDWGC